VEARFALQMPSNAIESTDISRPNVEEPGPPFQDSASFFETIANVFSCYQHFLRKPFCFFSFLSRRDPQGNSAISYIVRATSHLLDPRAPEFTASFVGRLVTTMIKKVSAIIM